MNRRVSPPGENPPVAAARVDTIPPRRPRFRWVRKFLFFIVLPVWVLFLFPWDWLLRRMLVYETPLEPAAVVLVGGLGGELTRAADLVMEGYVDRILITEGPHEKYRNEDYPASLHYLIQQDLLSAGVPGKLIFSLPHKPSSMADRQRMLREWIRENHCRSYVQFSGYYSSRMKKMLHDDTFPEGDVKLILFVSEGNVVWRKQWLGIQNTLIRMAYWYGIDRPEFLEPRP